MGAGRSTMGSVIAAQILLWKSGEMARYTAPSLGDGPCAISSYRIVHSLLRLIRSGLECKRLVDELVDRAGAVVNLRETIEDYRRRAADAASDPKEAYMAIRRGIFALKRYAMLLIFQAYLGERVCVPTPCQRPGTPILEPSSRTSTPTTQGGAETFEAWLSRHLEIQNLLSQIDREHGLDSIVPEEGRTVPGQGIALTSEVWRVVEQRKGSVLARMTILKDDHFPGCQRAGLAERIDGAPNFRRVGLPNGWGLYGVAMPTLDAIPTVIGRIGKDVVWVSLREEPVVFVRGHPYVLRVVKDPVTNLEMTGIISERVEFMEERLRADCLGEAQGYGHKLLVHGEEFSPTQGQYVVVPTWVEVSEEDMQTPQQVYAQFSSIRYHRVPITDEQAPIPSVFDILVQLIRTSGSANYVYNCQMGRGRTTTCMVVTLLYCTITENVPIAPRPQGRDHLLAGEFKLITGLQRLLPHGKPAKEAVDACIDACAHIQNLRECIPEYGERDRERGLNYLIRYFYLIAFAAYLLEQGEAARKDGLLTFTAWLTERREVTNLVARRDRIDLS